METLKVFLTEEEAISQRMTPTSSQHEYLLMLKNYALFIPVSPWVMLATFLRSWYAVSQTSGIAAAS
jgi:hypothetical protein